MADGGGGARVEADVEVINPLGVHARPAAALVTTAGRYPCNVWIEKNGVRVNAKSVMSLLMLAAAKGSKLRLICDGERSGEALEAMADLFRTGFGEMPGGRP